MIMLCKGLLLRISDRENKRHYSYFSVQRRGFIFQGHREEDFIVGLKGSSDEVDELSFSRVLDEKGYSAGSYDRSKDLKD